MRILKTEEMLYLNEVVEPTPTEMTFILKGDSVISVGRGGADDVVFFDTSGSVLCVGINGTVVEFEYKDILYIEKSYSEADTAALLGDIEAMIAEFQDGTGDEDGEMTIEELEEVLEQNER